MSDSPAAEPWTRDGSRTIYTQTGRQALALLADRLLPDGPRTLLAPAYLCDSMIQPFVDRGWRLLAYPMTPDLHPDGEEAMSVAASLIGEPFVALVAEYFGRSPDAGFRALIAGLQATGGTVIDDETHRVLDPRDAGADLTIASLRKVLPVATGAYLRSSARPLPEPRLPDEGEDAERWDAMDEKSRNGNGTSGSDRYKSLFAAADERLERADTPRLIGERSRRTLSVLDYTALAERRRSNAAALTSELAPLGVPVLNPPVDESIPSHLVVRVPRAAAVQRRMAARGVFCPIHWPESTLLPRGRPWPSEFLSIPVDHRYDADDMRRAARALQESLA
ncbi:hypothetical protein [Leifsonia sp. NPDC080035]|uniref:DegT/DnrJ/EryC1/StrS aminotransferase family protein n=1 Tax=Leifsonia sp. NPDC080035 TaxID=3143936 RepID=A0AAU7GG91_9MICO